MRGHVTMDYRRTMPSLRAVSTSHDRAVAHKFHDVRGCSARPHEPESLAHLPDLRSLRMPKVPAHFVHARPERPPTAPGPWPPGSGSNHWPTSAPGPSAPGLIGRRTSAGGIDPHVRYDAPVTRAHLPVPAMAQPPHAADVSVASVRLSMRPLASTSVACARPGPPVRGR